MQNEKMDINIMEYMVWVIEITSAEFFENDKTTAYINLKNSGLWDIYINSYDITHSLSKEYLIKEIREYFNFKGVDIS